MSIDWSKAPEKATHCDPVICCWYMRSDTGWLYFDRGIWSVSHIDYRIVDHRIVGLIARPPEWRNPQDELPPVGMEVDCYGGGGVWKRGTILAHVHGLEGKRAIFQRKHDWSYGAKDNFRPIQTDRDKAIDEIADALQRANGADIAELAIAVYDAGYRKGGATCSTR